MKILHISTSDNGGAANSCIRLHLSLLEAGIDSTLLTISKKKTGIQQHFTYNKQRKPGIFMRLKYRLGFDKPPYLKYELQLENKVKGYEFFSFTGTDFDLSECDLVKAADIINLHWVAGFLDYRTFFNKVKKPIVWTLHDMNAFSGGCHYSDGCNKYLNNCDVCPQLLGTIDPTYSHTQWEIKKASYEKADITIVAPSKWLSECASVSSLLNGRPVNLIPYSLDLDAFKPMSREQARRDLGLPPDRKILLFVSTSIDNKRKGLQVLLDSLTFLANRNDYLVCSVGQSDILNSPGYFSLGEIRDEKKMMKAYNSADVFVLPANEDNLPNVVLESLACGVPVIGFNIGGMPDMITNGLNGLLCQKISPSQLAETIHQFFSEKEKYSSELIRKDAVEKFNNTLQAERYISIYRNLIKKI
ncbi:MAG: glycosyltransferase [Bacteroidota bacterium]|nr:glycosyltransferase [Bacteroidota bacterium]